MFFRFKELFILLVVINFTIITDLKAELIPFDKQIVGWIEEVKLYPFNFKLEAKLDTGADNCSLHAEDIVEFEKDGKLNIAFTIKNRIGNELRVEREVKKITKIKRLLGESQKRYVVQMTICLGTQHAKVDVNLVDRTGFSYEMLIGRSFLQGSSIVDTSATFTTKPECGLDKPSKKGSY